MEVTQFRSSLGPLIDALVGIRDGYVADTREPHVLRGTQQKWRVKTEDSPRSVRRLEEDFVEWLEKLVVTRSTKYTVKASAGQIGRRYALIPYAMLLRRDITSTPTRGVYIALLFDESCQTLLMTLNQGVSQFRDRFGLRHVQAAIERSTKLIASLLPASNRFKQGPAGLNASHPYGKAYELGAILTHSFDLSVFEEHSCVEFEEALNELMRIYELVPQEIARDPSLVGGFGGAEVDEETYQEISNYKASSQTLGPLPDQPKFPPKRVWTAGVESYRRNPMVAAVALRLAEHKCEADCKGETFFAQSTGLPYMEAHHLIPMNQQVNFEEVSLDVPANIVALCPMCHAKIHLAIKKGRDPLIATLHARRQERLKKSGVECDLPRLLSMY